MTTVILGGGLARRPLNGGAPWGRVHWLLGLRQLGFEVFLVDQLETKAFVDRTGQMTTYEESLNLAYFQRVSEQFALAGSAALICGNGDEIYGIDRRELLEVAARADLLINLAGALWWEPILRRVPTRVYIDVDPGFTQFAHAKTGLRGIKDHQFHFSYGYDVGSPECPIPTSGVLWRPIRPPVVLNEWPIIREEGSLGAFTTVAAWRGRARGALEFRGRSLGLKNDEFKKFVDLPSRVANVFEVALNVRAPKPLLPLDAPQPAPEPEMAKDIDLLRQHGWKLVDPRKVAGDPLEYRRYVQRSGAEFSVAKGVYVETSSGWFSDRTACYLASGKPALVQDTGLGRTLPADEGLLAFRTLEEAVRGAEEIAADRTRHSRAARAIAEEYFDSAKVMGGLFEELQVAP